jgi:hypothetical protein
VKTSFINTFKTYELTACSPARRRAAEGCVCPTSWCWGRWSSSFECCSSLWTGRKTAKTKGDEEEEEDEEEEKKEKEKKHV